MRTTTVKIMLLAVLTLLSRYSVGTPAPQQDTAKMQAMTVAELEKAGDEARGQKDFAQAIQCFQAALKKDRKNAVLYNKLGLAELKKDALSDARADFERAIKRNPQYADAVNNVGAVEYMTKNYGSAAKYFKRAVALDETRATFHVNLGAAWFSQKKVEGALAEYSRALELDPDALSQNARAGIAAQISSPEERAQYSYMLAKIYAKRGDAKECLRCLRRAKEDGYRNLANVYKDEEFSRMRDNPRLHEVVDPPAR